MIGPARSVHGGVSAVVNNLYEAGLDKKVELTYLATMVDGSKLRKLMQAIVAYIKFLFMLPFAEILHVNMAADASYYRKKLFIDTAALLRKKIVIHEHGGDFQGFYYEQSNQRQQENIRKTLEKAHVFLVLSDTWKQFFANLINEDKIRVLQNGVAVPGEEKVDYSSHKVVFLGRLCKEKGIEELLDAVPGILREIPDFQLVLGGIWEKGNEELEEKAEKLAGSVFCPGWISAKERMQMFKECSLFVLPTWFEGQPISLLEAMAAGMCVVASKVGGIPQIMGQDMTTGVYLRHKDSGDITNKLILLLRDEQLRRSLGESARKRIREKYDICQKADELAGYYEKLMK